MSALTRAGALAGALAYAVAAALPAAALPAAPAPSATSSQVVTKGVTVPSFRSAAELTGDFDNNNTDTPAVFVRGVFFLRNTNSAGQPDVVVQHGRPSDIPVVGDWDGDGTDTIGVVRAHGRGLRWLLRNSNTAGPADIVVDHGRADRFDQPVVGDWDGDGDDSVGVAGPGRNHRMTWLLRRDVASPAVLSAFDYGSAERIPVVGDWDGDGDDTVGVVRERCVKADRGYCVSAALAWYQRNANTTGPVQTVVEFGRLGDGGFQQPLPGDWNGDGRDTLGLVEFRMDYNGERFFRLLRNANTAGRPDVRFEFG